MRKNLPYISILFLLLGTFNNLKSQGLSSVQIDSLVNVTLGKLPQAGIAVAVVKDGKVIHLKGYGMASIETRQKVNENTLFAIASNTKTFTSAALGILVDENKLSWNDKVEKKNLKFRKIFKN